MSKRNIGLIRASKEFSKQLDEIKLERIKRGFDKRLRPNSRLTLAMTRHTLFPRIKEDIIRSILDDKRGNFFDGLFWMIFAFGVFLMIAVIIFIAGLANGLFTNFNTLDNSYVNFTQINSVTTIPLNDGIQTLKYFGLFVFMGGAIGILVGSYLAPKPPTFLIIIELVLTFFAIWIAMAISNAYETFVSANFLNGGLSSLTASDYIWLNLPYIVGVVMLLSCFLLFLNIDKGRQSNYSGGYYGS